MPTTRRDFLAGAAKVALAVPFALPVLESCLPTSAPLGELTNNNLPLSSSGSPVDVSDLNDSHPFKVAPMLTGPDGFGVIVTFDASSTPPYHAFSQRCTHASCPVDTALNNGDIHCSCHGSMFALNGAVLTGPAPTKLTEYSSTFDANAKVLKIFPTVLP